MFGGVLVSNTYAGHEGRMAIVAFLPGVTYLFQRALERETIYSFLLAGLGLGAILLMPHVQMNYYLIALSFLYFIYQIASKFKTSRRWGQLPRLGAYYVISIAVGFLLSAIIYLPFYKYIPFSPRGGEEGRGYEFATSWPLNPEETINIAVPEFSGSSVGQGTYWGRNFFKLNSEYMGAVAVFLAILGAVFSRKTGLKWFFLIIILLCLTVAWGGHTPIYKLYYNLVPGFKKFRAPSLILFLIAFSSVVLSSLGLQAIIDKIKSKEQLVGVGRFIMIFMASALVLAFLISIGGSGVKEMMSGLISGQSSKLATLNTNFPKFMAGMWKFAVLITIIGGILLGLLKGKLKLAVAGILLSLLTVLDLWIVGSKFVQTVPPPQFTFRPDVVVTKLKEDPQLFRVFPLQYRNDNYMMLFNLQNVGGEHGNQLQRYNEFLGAGKTSMVDYHNMSSLNFLSLANAKYIVTTQPSLHAAFTEVLSQDAFVYRYDKAAPRAFAVGSYEVIYQKEQILGRMKQADFDPVKTVILEKQPGQPGAPDSLIANIAIVEYQPMTVRIQAEMSRPGFLVLLDNYYPDWKAFVDGKETEIYRADYTFRAIQLESGKHEVEFRFVPKYYLLGKKISIFSFLAVVAILGSGYFLQRRSSPNKIASES